MWRRILLVTLCAFIVGVSMAWTTPRDWATGELVTAAQMNEQLRDNMKYLVENRARTLFVPCVAVYRSDGVAAIRSGVMGCAMADNLECSAYGNFYLPADYVSGLTIKAIGAGNASGDAYLRSTAYHQAVGETAVWTHVDQVAYAAVTLTKWIWTEMQTLTPSNVAAGDYYQLMLERNAVDATDTIANDVYISGWLITYTSNGR